MPYSKIAFQAFSVTNVSGPLSLPAHSPTNVITSGIRSSVTSGQATITRDYVNSRVTNFDLLTAFIACKVATSGTGNFAQPCTLRFIATAVTGRTVIFIAPAYRPGSLFAPMQKIVFPTTFRQLVKFVVVIQDSSTMPVATSFALNDVEFQIYSTQTEILDFGRVGPL